MLLRQMKYFVAIVDCDSFTEAAEQCYISQSAISQQIQSLERDLGIKLIHRENRKFFLTPAGEYFYSHCKIVLEEMEELRRETIRIGQAEESGLRIGFLRCYGGQELHQTVAEFSGLYPEISVDIMQGTHEELYDLLRFGGVDLVLNDQRRAFSEEYVNFELLKCGCYVEVSNLNPLSKQSQVGLGQLKRIPCILVSSKEQQKAEQEYYKKTLGFWREISLCGKSGGRETYGGWKQGISSYRKSGNTVAGESVDTTTAAMPWRKTNPKELLCFLEKGA